MGNERHSLFRGNFAFVSFQRCKPSVFPLNLSRRRRRRRSAVSPHSTFQKRLIFYACNCVKNPLTKIKTLSYFFPRHFSCWGEKEQFEQGAEMSWTHFYLTVVLVI
jgi:hypothetical protein